MFASLLKRPEGSRVEGILAEAKTPIDGMTCWE